MLGAAMVDTYMDRKHPKKKGGMRHMAVRSLAQAAVGNLIVQPVVKTADARTGFAGGTMAGGGKKRGLMRRMSERFVRP
jgi:hypothetical protein